MEYVGYEEKQTEAYIEGKKNSELLMNEKWTTENPMSVSRRQVNFSCPGHLWLR